MGYRDEAQDECERDARETEELEVQLECDEDEDRELTDEDQEALAELDRDLILEQQELEDFENATDDYDCGVPGDDYDGDF